jgi:hypothetical protein
MSLLLIVWSLAACGGPGLNGDSAGRDCRGSPRHSGHPSAAGMAERTAGYLADSEVHDLADGAGSGSPRTTTGRPHAGTSGPVTSAGADVCSSSGGARRPGCRIWSAMARRLAGSRLPKEARAGHHATGPAVAIVETVMEIWF